MERRYYVVDAFTSRRFAGNAAAVVLDADCLDDTRMQAIAAEFNLSETTFVLQPPSTAGADPAVIPGDSGLFVRFRWFTPTTEVAMCGHATVAGVHALVESGRLPLNETSESTSLRIETLSGTLTAFVEPIPGSEQGRMIWLDLVDPTLTPYPVDTADLASALRLPADAFDPSLPVVRTQDGDLLVFVGSYHMLNESHPDFGRLAELLERTKSRGFCLATVNTLTPSIQVQSRFFAPTCGVDEDPVTGSVHGPLAAYLVEHGLVETHDGIAGFTCAQAKAGGRAGLVHALVQPQGEDRYAVRIGGQAVTTMRGTLFL